jgi:hypothetical protein
LGYFEEINNKLKEQYPNVRKATRIIGKTGTPTQMIRANFTRGKRDIPVPWSHMESRGVKWSHREFRKILVYLQKSIIKI